MNPIVYFEVVGPDAGVLRDFYAGAFGWSIDAHNTIAAASAGLRGGVRQDPADKVFYVGVDDINAALATIVASGGTQILPRTEVRGVVTFALFKDPAGNLLGLAEHGSFPT